MWGLHRGYRRGLVSVPSQDSGKRVLQEGAGHHVWLRGHLRSGARPLGKLRQRQWSVIMRAPWWSHEGSSYTEVQKRTQKGRVEKQT